jgi:D-aminoacyl-tRNA deacylase
MRAIIQRVKQASVAIDDKIVAEIGTGLLVFIGISRDDGQSDAAYLALRIPRLRIFEEANQEGTNQEGTKRQGKGKMNRDVTEVGGSLLVVPNFTLYGECRKGLRPSFDAAAPPEQARPLFEYLVSQLKEQRLSVEMGVFQADMDVSLLNSGPVTLIVDSP